MAARKQEVEAKLPLEEDGYEENDTGYVVTHRNPTEESEHFRKRCFLGRRFLGSCFFRSASGRVKATFSPSSLSSDSLLSSNHASLDFSAYISGSRHERKPNTKLHLRANLGKTSEDPEFNTCKIVSRVITRLVGHRNNLTKGLL